MSYNSLDNIEAAKQLREKLILEQQDIRSSLSYEYATSWCDNCPRREREPQTYSELEFGIQVASVCCKEDEVWEEQHQSEHQHRPHDPGAPNPGNAATVARLRDCMEHQRRRTQRVLRIPMGLPPPLACEQLLTCIREQEVA